MLAPVAHPPGIEGGRGGPLVRRRPSALPPGAWAAPSSGDALAASSFAANGKGRGTKLGAAPFIGHPMLRLPHDQLATAFLPSPVVDWWLQPVWRSPSSCVSTSIASPRAASATRSATSPSAKASAG